MARSATLLAGIPSDSPTLLHRTRFAAGDPAAWIALPGDDGDRTILIIRDIEVARARAVVAADQVACPADFAPAEGLSGDRATATAQAAAECLRRHGVKRAVADRTLPFIYAWHVQSAGIALDYSPDLGVLDRRAKSAEELEWIGDAQRATEEAMRMACQTIARATADASGALMHEGQSLTSERMRRMISVYLMERDYSTPHDSIVATTPHSADCHHRGTGPLVTGQAVIIDIFPRSNQTHYWGDCTRTVVHGEPSDAMHAMHDAVVSAKRSAIAAARAGVAASDVHAAARDELLRRGYPFERGAISDAAIFPHGTGHGVGLELHEPILLDDGGGTLLNGEVLTIEPGLYSRQFGGVRVEDMVVVTRGEPRNLNQLPESLDWR